MTTLANYEVQVADLLHDPSNLIWSTTQLDRYINEARRQLTMDTGCLRSLQTAYFTQGVETYPFGQITGAAITAGGTGYTGTPTVAFSGGGGTGVAATLSASGGAVTSITFTNLGSGYTSAPTAVVSGTGTGATISVGAFNLATYDVLDVHIIYGSTRYATSWCPWSIFSRKWRSNTTVQMRPAAWATFGLTQIYLGPLPDQTYQADVDTVILPTDIAGGTVDPIPPVVQDPIKFYAAYLAKNNAQQYGEAESFRGQYGRRLLEVAQPYTRRMGNVLWGNG
jgi:hypothetical protein